MTREELHAVIQKDRLAREAERDKIERTEQLVENIVVIGAAVGWLWLIGQGVIVF